MAIALTGKDPQDLRRELQEGNSESLNWRRGIVAASLVGMAAMGAVSLLQTGVIRHLADPPLRGFDSDKVNSSDTAYALGVPDGTLSLACFAANVPLAAFGGTDRARTMPWLPLTIAGKAIVEALIAAWYFYQMPVKEKAWCGYCITDAAMNLTIAGLTLPEARAALRRLREEQ